MKKVILPGLAAGLAVLCLSLGFNFFFNLLFPALSAEYLNQSIFRPWSDPMMQLFFLHPFIMGLALAFVWDRTKNAINGKNALERGFYFGGFIFLVATIPGMFVTFSSFQVSPGLVLSWTLSGLLQVITGSLILAKLNK